MKYLAALCLCFTFLTDCFAQSFAAEVNPFIGTGGHGHTFPGAVRPFGMVQLSPDTRADGSWDGCSGYHYSDSIILGFSHTHLSGTGVSDWGDILVMPVDGKAPERVADHSSVFRHSSEQARAGYYEVFLEKPRVKSRLTATPRTGIHLYEYAASAQPGIWIDLLHRDKTIVCGLKIQDSVTISGYRVSEAWAKEQHVYFVAKFSRPFKTVTLYSDGKVLSAGGSGRTEGAFLSFDSLPGPLMLKVGISFSDAEGAARNLAQEAPHWDFSRYCSEAETDWNRQLGKITVSGNDANKRKVFYSALYHCFIHPSLNMDVDGRFRGMDGKIHIARGFTNYSVFSLWDTYRALHPLLSILEPLRTADFINTFLSQFRQSGRLPVWELSSNETNCMIGFHSVSVINDAICKNIGGFDRDEAYKAMKISAGTPVFGLLEFNRKGFLQVNDESESVSKTLEYGYDSWCISRTAAYLGRTAEERIFRKRSLAYVNLFDRGSGMMRPRRNGGWLTPFHPTEISNHYTEGNSWHYSFYVPHDIAGLIELHGSKSALETKLDTLFNTSERTRGRQQADVTGLIGQYAHGNEPSHHMAYLYNYVGSPEKTRQLVRKICSGFYTNSPEGLIGNEDCGQMSAWYVFSALGLYPVCPGRPVYDLGVPQFSEARLNLDNGRSFSVRGSGLQKEHFQISLNERPLQWLQLGHSDITKGGVLNFEGTDKGPGWPEAAEGNSVLSGSGYVAAPLITTDGRVFRKNLQVSFSGLVPEEMHFYYTVNGNDPDRHAVLYKGPFFIDTTCTIRVRAYLRGDSSTVTEASFFRMKNNYAVSISSSLDPQYTAEGPASLCDGIYGDTDWRKGDWLGCQGQDLVINADLKQKRRLNVVTLNCLQDTRSWILLPEKIDLYVSDDKVNYRLAASVGSALKMDDYKVQTFGFKMRPGKNTAARYVRIVARWPGKLPQWHMGSGGASFIFADELEFQ